MALVIMAANSYPEAIYISGWAISRILSCYYSFHGFLGVAQLYWCWLESQLTR